MQKMHTPWGQADYHEFLNAENTIVNVGTSSHGGIGVHISLPMPEYLDCETTGQWRWYEEDIDWAKVALAYPQAFTPQAIESAKLTILNWHPKIYEKHFGHKPTAAESFKVAEEENDKRLINHYRVHGGFGDWAWDVPKGYVYATGYRKSDNSNAGFLVPSDVYNENPSRLILDDFPRWEPDKTFPYSKPRESKTQAASFGEAVK